MLLSKFIAKRCHTTDSTQCSKILKKSNLGVAKPQKLKISVFVVTFMEQKSSIEASNALRSKEIISKNVDFSL